MKKTTAPLKAAPASAPDAKTADDKDKKKRTGLARKRSPLAGLVVWAVVALVLAGSVAVLAWPLWRAPALDYVRAHAPESVWAWVESKTQNPDVAPLSAPVSKMAPAPDARLVALERALAETNEQLVRLSDRLAGASDAPMDVSPLIQKIEGLEKRLMDAEQKLAAADTNAGIGLLLLGQVQGGLMAGAPYADTLAALRKILADDAAAAPLLARLGATAQTGVPTRQRLADDFSGVSRDIARAIRRDTLAENMGTVGGNAANDDGGKSPGWLQGLWASVWGKVSSLVVVRRVNVTNDGNGGADALLARAETALGRGDLEGAVIALDGLGAGAAKTAETWQARARQRLDADGAFQALQTLFLSRVALGGK